MPASTTPDGIVYPLSTDPIAPLNTHFEDLADSVQDALAGSGVPYRYGGTVRFTSSGTFTKALYPGLRAIKVRCIGGGGGGGGGTGAAHGAGGGGGGSYAESFISDMGTVASSVTVTRGFAGTGVSGASGNNGGPSSFGATVVAGGGLGGNAAPGSGSGGNGGTATAGDIQIGGGGGYHGSRDATTGSSQRQWQGAGGDSIMGFGGRGSGPSITATAGTSGSGFGAGGSGSSSGSTGSLAGGDGTAGIVTVDLYY